MKKIVREKIYESICPMCKGEGWYWDNAVNPYYDSEDENSEPVEYYQQPCQYCNATGEVNEAAGAGFSMHSTSRGGFGGANNMGGPNMMYTYEIKPLNHALEQRPSSIDIDTNEIRIGSIIVGSPVKSNANPEDKRIKGIVQQIIKTNDNSIKYYIVFDEATASPVKIEPLGAQLVIHAPIEYYDSKEIGYGQRRIKSFVRESIK